MNDQMAGVTGKQDIGDGALCAGADGDHFGDATAMVLSAFSGVGAGYARLVGHLHEVAPVGKFRIDHDARGWHAWGAARWGLRSMVSDRQ